MAKRYCPHSVEHGRSANREAATCFEQALDALRRLPEHPDAIAESLDIRFDLRNALLLLGEGGRIGTLLDEAEVLAEAVGDQRRLGRALNDKVIQFSLAGDLAAALRAGLRALAIGEPCPTGFIPGSASRSESVPSYLPNSMAETVWPFGWAFGIRGLLRSLKHVVGHAPSGKSKRTSRTVI